MNEKEGYDAINLERKPIKDFIKDDNWNICITFRNENYILALDKLFNRVVYDYFEKDITYYKCFRDLTDTEKVPFSEREKEYINMSLQGIPDLVIEFFNFFKVLYRIPRFNRTNIPEHIENSTTPMMAISYLNFSKEIENMIYNHPHFSYNIDWDNYFSENEKKKLKKYRFFIIKEEGKIKLDPYFKDIDCSNEYLLSLGELYRNSSHSSKTNSKKKNNENQKKSFHSTYRYSY